MLTKKQRDLLLFINGRLQQGDVVPSFEEMKDALGLKSKSGIHRLISALEERGYLERLPHRARALEIKRLPEGYRNEPASAPAPAPAWTPETFSAVPLYGKIAAGTPIEALRDDGNSVDVPPALAGQGAHYALRVEGDSMIEAGINDSDIVVIRRCEDAEDGQIVVALVNGEEATLKRLARRKGKIALIPENMDYHEQVYDPDQVMIQGRLVGLMRAYN